MSTSAEQVNIQALSAEPFASAACTSSLAKRELTSVDGLGGTPALWARRAGANVKANNAIASPIINLFPRDTAPAPVQSMKSVTRGQS